MLKWGGEAFLRGLEMKNQVLTFDDIWLNEGLGESPEIKKKSESI